MMVFKGSSRKDNDMLAWQQTLRAPKSWWVEWLVSMIADTDLSTTNDRPPR